MVYSSPVQIEQFAKGVTAEINAVYMLALVALSCKALDLLLAKVRAIFCHQDEQGSMAEQWGQQALFSEVLLPFKNKTKLKTNHSPPHSSETARPSRNSWCCPVLL